MDEFITSQVILSLAGCVGIVLATTQLIKKFTSLDPRIIALIISLIVGVIRIIVMGNYDVVSIAIGIINIVPILWGAMGGYDMMLKLRCDNQANENDNKLQEKSNEKDKS